MTKFRTAAIAAARAFGTTSRSRAGTTLKEPFHPSQSKGVIPDSSGYGKVAELQKQWAVDDGLMVWQKKGLTDQIPYLVSLAGSAVGVGICFYQIFLMSFPKKNA